MYSTFWQMKLPPSSRRFMLNMANNPLGKVYYGAISINEKENRFPKMSQLGWYQIVMLLKGEGLYRGAQGQAVALRCGDLIITAPGMPCQFGPSKGTAWSIMTIAFNGPLFDFLYQSGWLKCHSHAVALSPVSQWYQKIFNLLHLQKDEENQPNQYLFRFLSVLDKILHEKQTSAQNMHPAWLTTAISMIEAFDPSKVPDIKHIAKACKIGHSSFRHQFSHLTGYGPLEYHKNLRIKTASEMIAYGSESFKQIALQLGFNDENYFARFFKEKTGLSPSQFKAELVKRNIKIVDGERVQKLALQEWFKAEEEKRRLEDKTATERRRNWRLVFKEDFANRENLSRWDIQGDWECKNGELCIRSKDGLFATLNTPIPGDVRLVFDCHLESAFLSDISCFLSALNPSEKAFAYTTGYFCQTGYVFQYGAFQNRRITLASSRGILWNQPASPLVRGKIYHVDAQKIGNRLILNVDDKTIFDVRDHNAVFGTEHAFLGLHSWGTEACFSNVQIYTRDSAVQADLLDTAEDFLARGDYSTAKGLFQEVVNSSQNVQRIEAAKHGLARTLNRIVLTAEFPSIQKRLLKTWPKAIIKLDAPGIIVNISASEIEDLSPLHGLPVSELYCDSNRITSLQPLEGMKGLRNLSCYKNQIKSVEPLRGMNLIFLECSDNQIAHLEALRGMELKHLACAKNQLADVEPLRGMKLDVLFCGCNQIESLDPLRGMGLLRLSFPDNRVMSLAPLQGMSLDFLNCSWNQITDLEPLRGMRLSQLRCNGNYITSLAPLHGLPLSILRCAWNRIDDLTPVKEMTFNILSCHDNPIKSIHPLLQQLPRGFYFSLENLNVAEQQRLRARCETPGFAELLRNAEILFHLKQKNYDKIKSLAQPFGNHRYLIIPREATWLEGKKWCEELGGHLAVIRNREANDFLRSKVVEGAYTCIGLYSENKKMAWVSGEPYRFQNMDSKLFLHGHSCVLSSSGIWSGNYPWLECDGFCVEWDESVGCGTS